MKASVYSRYGPPEVLQWREVADPVPGDGELLVRIHAAAANPVDWHFIRGAPYFMRLISGMWRPKRSIPGVDFAGVVHAAGSGVTELRPGDEVYGASMGAFAEYLCVPQGKVARKPTGLTFEQAAAVPLAGLTALQLLRDSGDVQAGQRVLVIGASGGVGTCALQIARSMGAHVTGVCSTRNLELVRSLGADEVIDYTREDFLERDETWNVVLQLAGTAPPSRLRRVLTRDGTLILCSGESSGRWIGPLSRTFKALALSPFVSQKLASPIARERKEDLEHLTALIDAGELTPVIDRTYPLSETADAIRYLEQGHARGKVVLVPSTA